MAFKKAGNQAAVKAFYDLYYQKDQVNTFIKAEGFLPVTNSGLQEFATDPKLKVYLDTLPNVHLTPTDDPTWDKVKLAVQQNIGAGIDGNPKAVLDDAAEDRRERRLTVTEHDPSSPTAVTAQTVAARGGPWRSPPPTPYAAGAAATRASMPRRCGTSVAGAGARADRRGRASSRRTSSCAPPAASTRSPACAWEARATRTSATSSTTPTSAPCL